MRRDFSRRFMFPCSVLVMMVCCVPYVLYTNVWAMTDAKMPPAGGIPSMTLILGNEAKKP